MGGFAVAQTAPGDARQWIDGNDPLWFRKAEDGSWRELAPQTASETLLGPWEMRILSRYGGYETHNELVIDFAGAGALTGHILGSDAGAFLNGAARAEGGRTLLSFDLPVDENGWWTGIRSGETVHVEAEFSGGRFTGMVTSEDGETLVPWYARRPDERDDLGGYIVGNWALDVVSPPGTECDETYRYRDDGTVTVRSGEEVLEKTWALVEDGPYRQKLVEEVISTNGMADCQGNAESQPGDESTKWVVFGNSGGWAVCSGPDVGLCYGNVSELHYAAAPAPERPSLTAEQQGLQTAAANFARARAGCQQGEASACFIEGNYLYNGIAATKNLELARAAYNSACKLGHAKGCAAQAVMMAEGKGGKSAPRDARKLLKENCTETEFAGCWELGAMQYEGKGGRTDIKGAKVSLERACGIDDARACFTLSAIHFGVKGGTRDIELGRSLIGKACDLGQAEACEWLEENDEVLAAMAGK